MTVLIQTAIPIFPKVEVVMSISFGSGAFLKEAEMAISIPHTLEVIIPSSRSYGAGDRPFINI